MLKVLELFAGIGSCSKALTNLGIEHEIVDAVEIDKFAIKSFNAIHGTDFEPQDITEWNKEYYCEACQRLVGESDDCPRYKSLLAPAQLNVDLIMHGSPCQDFSVAGLGRGGDEGSGTRSSLMYETLRIVGKLKPKYVIWENVPAVLSKKHYHNFSNYIMRMRNMGYMSLYAKLNAKDYGVPQNRVRVFTVSVYMPEQAKQIGGDDLSHLEVFSFPEPRPLDKLLKDVLEPSAEERYYLSEEKIKSMKMTNFTTSSYDYRVNNENGVARTLMARDYKDPQCVKVGDLNMNGYDSMKRVYSSKGLSPTLTTMGGSSREPKIVAMRGRTPDNPSDRTTGTQTEQRLEVNTKGVSNTLTSFQKDNMVLESNFRVRKLTPKECWRLMGFSDEDFDKASKVSSNSQLYKQASNSIVVPVLEAILNNLLEEK